MTNIIKKEEQSALQLFNPQAKVQSAEDLERLEIRDLQSKEALQARLQKTLRQELTQDLERLVSMECMKAVERIGQNNLEPSRAEIIQEDVMAHLSAKCFNWTANEVVIAFRMGALGELGEPPRHLTSQIMIQWLYLYDQKIRKKATRDLKDAVSDLKRLEGTEKEEARDITPEEKKSSIADQFERYKQTGTILGASIAYKHLNELKALKLTKEARWDFIAKAIVETTREAKEALANPITKNTARKRIDQVKAIEIGKASTLPEFIKTRAQEIAVREYFEHCQEIEMSPLDLIEL